MPYYTPELARRILLDYTEKSPVSVEPGTMNRYDFLAHDHVVVGDVALRGHKRGRGWKLDAREVQEAGKTLAALELDHADLVSIGLDGGPTASLEDEDQSETDWRGMLRSWVYDEARDENAERRCVCGEPVCRRPGIRDNGLRCAMTWERLTQMHGDRVIAGTKPLPLLSWSGTEWLLPRAYADLLDRAMDLEARLREKAQTCASCRTKGTREEVWHWRTSSSAGFITQCPSCATASFPPYTGHLRNTLYRNIPKGSRADAYLCCLCQQRRAFYWDHCHDHDFVRGPACASCNTFEGGGKDFVLRPGAMKHLLQCRTCRERRSIAKRHVADVAGAFLTPRGHEDCRRSSLSLRAVEENAGVTRFRLRCLAHDPPQEWDQNMGTVEVAKLVHGLIEQTLAQTAAAPTPLVRPHVALPDLPPHVPGPSLKGSTQDGLF